MLEKIFPPVKFPVNPYFRFPAFLLVLLQVVALYAVIYFYRLEPASGLSQLLPWFTGGFIVHSLLPARFRQPFFVLLTAAAIVFFTGVIPGLLIVLTILGFLGIAHLPFSFRIRVAMLLLATVALLLLRMQIIYAPRLTLIAKISGLFLMFRMILYMHELKHEKTKPTYWQRLSYFFMLPNLCFPLFPLVDYKTFLANQYNDSPAEISRSGIRKLLRGIVHLLLYRLVYLYLVPSPVMLHGPADFFIFIFTSYMLILRMSGIFYIALGTLHLFGYNMPPIFHNFFLIPSFGEIWRRINIYWKDFVTKVFYYPLWFRLRKKKNINPLLVTGLITFVFVWQLHSWQWFWVLGRYQFSFIDFLYWIILGGVITANLVVNEKNPPAKQNETAWSFKRALVLVLRIAGINIFMSLLWSLWNSKSFGSWGYLLSHLKEGNFSEWLTCAGIFAAIILAGILVYYCVIRFHINIDKPMRFGTTAFVSLFAAIVLLLPFLPAAKKSLPLKLTELVAAIQKNQLSQYDKENSEQGYYEQLLEDPNTGDPWEVHVNKTGGRKGSEQITIHTNNLLQQRLKPNTKAKIEFYTASINSWGMRDKEYSREKPARTFRIALLGGSYEMGVGVNDNETYEALVEAELNKRLIPNDSIDKIEILNFAVSGYHLIQQTWLADHEVFDFHPDLVIYVAHSEDPRRLNGFFASLIQNGVPLEYPFLVNIKEQCGAKQSMSRDEIRSRLLPSSNDIFTWGYSKIAADCHMHNAGALWLFLPATADKINEQEVQQQRALAEKCGFETLILREPYKGIDIRTIQLSDDDTHPNAEGHQLIAKSILFAFLHEDLTVFRKLQFQNNIHL